MADSRPRDVLKAQTLAYLRNHGERAYRPKELAKTLGLTDNLRYRLFLEGIEELVESGAVARGAGGGLQHKKARPTREAEGVLSAHPQGYGFVSVEGIDEDVYVSAERMGTALHGDRVRLAMAAPVRGEGRTREAEITAVLERGRARVVGTFSLTGHAGWVKPDDARFRHDVHVPREAWNGARPGDKVVASVDAFDDPKASPEGRVLEVIGPGDAPGVAVLALAMAHGARPTFPEEVEREAAAVPVRIPEEEIARRLDLRQERVFTIDPVDAKDFDDAVHVKPLPNGHHEVGVHIADVAHYVREGTALDGEAYVRGTSTYLVDRVIPMLPEALSNGVCSLRPNEDKLTFSCV